MTTEWGALAGVFPTDDVTIDWLKKRAEAIAKRGPAKVPSDADGGELHPRMNPTRINELAANRPAADQDASYAKELTLDLATVQPHLSGPDTVKVMKCRVSTAGSRILPKRRQW